MPKGKPFVKNDPRANVSGRPKKKTLQDILDEIGAVVVKDKNGKALSRTEGEERLMQAIIEAGLKEKNHTMMKFIFDHINTMRADPELAEVKKRAELARAAKLEIANAKARGELIEFNLIKKIFGEIYSIHRSIFISGSPIVAVDIAAKLGVKDDAQKMMINEEVDAHCYKTLAAVKRKIDDFLTACENAPLPDEPETKPAKGRAKKCKTSETI